MSQLEKARVERDFAELVEQGDREKQEAIGERPLCWLALLPEWTVALAQVCRFPADPGGLEPMLDEAERAGLCLVRRRSRGVEETVRFWMPEQTRSWLFERWQLAGGPDLREEIRQIASRIRTAHASGETEISPGVLRWAELALGELAAPVVTGEVLTDRVTRSLKDGDTSAAGEWIFAGEALGVPLGAEMKLAAALARRGLNLHYRRLQDERYVAEFVKREEQIKEMRRLVKSEDEWAVHFIGQSGVGKTMLMRYLTGRLHDADPFTFSARVDFDHIDPRFPLEAPARLLQELGEGLAANLTDAGQEAKYRSFREAVTRVEAEPVLADSDPLETAQFKEVIATFATFIKALPEPVVLILDTCEELAKLYPAGEDLPSIRAMFRIINQVHDAAPTSRVVLAGRRWLTREAANKVRGLAMPPAVEKMEPRPYMRMHSVRGFTRDEVVEYLREARSLDLSDEMIEAILENTHDPGAPASLDKEVQGPKEQPLYGPSDVALFAGWIEREEDLKPEALAGGNRDPYVEVRIFERIDSQEVLAAIPAAILLERFDGETIRPALEGGSQAQDRAIAGLIEQEWTHLEDGPGPDDIVISIDSGLLRRLRDYFDREPERRVEREDARRRLTPHLTQMFERPTSEVAPDRIDSAVRALPLEETLRMLDRMEERVVSEPAWPWAESVGRFLLSREREPPLPPPLVASVRALYVAALKHRRSSADLGELWEAVIDEAPKHPDQSHALALETRGRLGVLTTAASNGGYDLWRAKAVLTEGRRMLHRPALEEAVAPGLLAAIEAIADGCEERGYPIPVESVRTSLTALLEWSKGDAPVWAYVLALEGRVGALAGEWEAAREAFARLEDMVPEEVHGEPRFADWVPPTSIGHRTLLELLRFRLADGSENGELIDRCERAALEQPGGADGAQLLSLALQARLAYGGLAVDDLEGAKRFEESLESPDLTVPAHRVAPPLFASLAEAWLAVGRPADALALLSEREQAAVARRTDEDATAAAALATVRILRALRSSERLGLIGGFSSAEDDELRAEALAAGALIAGLRPPLGPKADRDHAAWRSWNLLDPREGKEALRSKRESKIPPGNSPAALHAALDRFEAKLVQRQWSGIGRLDVFWAERAVMRITADRNESPSIGEPLADEKLRLQLRLSALLAGPSFPVETYRARQVGRLALKEGELLALRLPERALPLLQLAERCLGEAGHPYGAFFAALRRAIAEIHAGRLDDARSRKEGILGRFEEIRRQEPAMPTVESLLRGDRGESFDSAADTWPGWTERLTAYLKWCDDPDPEAGEASLDSEPELALVPAAGAPGTMVPSGAFATRRPLVLAFLVTILVGALLGLIFGQVVGDSRLMATAAIVGALVGLATVSLIVEVVAKLVPRAILPVDVFDVTISLAPQWSAGTMMAEARVDPWARRWYVRTYFRLWRAVRPRSRREALIPPTDEAIDRAPSGPLALAARPRVGGGFTPIRLAVTSNLAPLAWERRLVGHLIHKDGWSPDSTPAIWRIRPPGHFAPTCDRMPPPLTAVCSPQWRPFVQSVSGMAVDWLPGSSASPARAAVALGFPVFTRAGWRLRLDDELSRTTEDVDQPRSQRLLSPDRLVRKAPIAVVVARPGGHRLASDPRIAEGLRGFANETFLAGAHAVIAVPALPPERTAEAIRLLTDEISSWDDAPDADLLQELATRLRGVVFEPLPESGAEDQADPEQLEEDRTLRGELALDVCLFAPH